jgi:hypothetical protein
MWAQVRGRRRCGQRRRLDGHRQRPQPAGQSILKGHFDGGVSPVGLFRAAVVPTLVVFGMFMLFL